MTAAALAVFWLLYFGGMGIFFPYFALYLKENAGLSGSQVGVVLAVLPLVGIVAQPVWGQIADRSGARSAVVAALALGAALGYAALAAAHGFAAIVLATAALALFSTSVIPVSVSLALGALRDGGPYAFGLVRVWGTLGYLACVVAFPWLLHRAQRDLGWSRGPGGPSEPGLALLFWATALLSLAAAAIGPFLPRRGATTLRARHGDWRLLLREPAVLRVTLFTFGAYLFLQGPMGMFPIYIRSLGGDMNTLGGMWVSMLLLEIPLVALSGAGVRRLGARGLLGIGVAAGGLRWVICGLTGDLAWVYPVQLLHGMVVAGLMLGGPLYLDAAVPERLRSTAQTLLSMLGVGVGGILSNATSGWLVDHAGTRAPYLIGGAGALLLGACVFRLLPTPSRPAEQSLPAEPAAAAL